MVPSKRVVFYFFLNKRSITADEADTDKQVTPRKTVTQRLELHMDELWLNPQILFYV